MTTPVQPGGTEAGGVSARHPLYSASLADWEQMADTYAGSRAVKSKGQLYLPATSGMEADGLLNANAAGYKAYSAYLKRAYFPDFIRETVQTIIGIMHHKPPQIELPSALEPMRERATLQNESLDALLRRINEEQLVTGRMALLLDMPSTASLAISTPYIAFYSATRLINWDTGTRDGITVDNLNLVVLDESEHERKSDFTWQYEQKFRVLTLSPDLGMSDLGPSETRNALPEGQGVYMTGVIRDPRTLFSPSVLSTPTWRGNTLSIIPLVIINSVDVVASPDNPPLLGLSDLALTVYRGDADYRQTLFMQGQDTLVVIGANAEDENFRVGANAMIKLPIGGDAKFIGVESDGLPEMRSALENDKREASQKGGKLLDTVSRQAESGEALDIRMSARTASINQIALAGAFGLEQLLKKAALWVGADPAEVKVTPNLDFVDDMLTGQELVQFVAAKNMGAPISLASLHKLMQDKGLTEMSLEDELALLESERPLGSSSSERDGPEPDDPDDEDDEDDEDNIQ